MLSSIGKTDSVISVIENRVVTTDKNVAQDPEWAGRCRDVQSKESRNASRYTRVVANDLQHIVFTLQREIPSADGESDFGQIWDSAAVDLNFQSILYK